MGAARSEEAQAVSLYYRIKAQRSQIAAPVDTMGSAAVIKNMKDSRRIVKFNLLVALLLSSQTRDQETHRAMCSLRDRLAEVSPEGILGADEETVKECIAGVGFRNKKLGYMMEISRRLENRDIPETLEEILALPGIGKKMAFLYLEHGCNKVAGISVDTHVHRVSNRIGLCRTRSPEMTRRALENALDASEWGDVNLVLVGFGQVVCRGVSPRCAECCVRDECPSSRCRKAPPS